MNKTTYQVREIYFYKFKNENKKTKVNLEWWGQKIEAKLAC